MHGGRERRKEGGRERGKIQVEGEGKQRGERGWKKEVARKKDAMGLEWGERRDLRRRRRLICQGVAGHLWDPEASIVGVQTATQDVLYPFLLNYWDQLGVTCRNPFNFLNGSLTIQDRVRHKYNAGLLSESGL